MKRLSLIVSILLCFGFTLVSKAENNSYAFNNSDKKVFIGLGYGIGVFYPSDVNEYIENKVSGYMITAGTEDIFVNFVGKFSVTYRINPNIDLVWSAEGAWAPKFIVGADEDASYFAFNRVSPGFMPKFHLPLKSGRHSLFIGPGINYNIMSFETFKGSALGYKVEAGLSLNFGKFNMQPFVSFDSAKAVDKGFELNYTGGEIGINFLF